LTREFCCLTVLFLFGFYQRLLRKARRFCLSFSISFRLLTRDLGL
jgi:hypothetical protein